MISPELLVKLMQKLDDKGRCCGRKPIHYKGRYAPGGPHKYCSRCDRAFDIDTGEQINNWAWKVGSNGIFYRQTGIAI